MWMGANEELVLSEWFLKEICFGSVLPPECTGFTANNKVAMGISAFLYLSVGFTSVFNVLV